MIAAPRILLADDDGPTSRLMQLTLELDGFQVRTSRTRDEALVVASEQKPDVVIMDFLMAGLDPASFLARLREDGFTGAVLLCTAFDGAIELAADGVLKKPFDPSDLVESVRSLLKKAPHKEKPI